MYVRRNLRPSIVLWFCWRQTLFFILLSFVVYAMYSPLHLSWVAVPFLPVGTIGTAVAFYIGFKNNSSYERLWEGRKIWGAITSLARSFGMLVSSVQSESLSHSELQAVKENLIRRQIAWCDLLRLQLRRSADYWNADRFPDEVGLMKRFNLRGEPARDFDTYLRTQIAPEDGAIIESRSNPSAALLHQQILAITGYGREGVLSELEVELLLVNINDCLKEQSGAERLKSFPFPRQYAYFSGVFVWIFLLLLPFSLVGELPKAGATLDWMVIPFSTLISWIFLTMEQVGDTSEDPFEMGLNDVPLSAICRNIERELLEMLGEKDLPERLRPVADVLL